MLIHSFIKLKLISKFFELKIKVSQDYKVDIFPLLRLYFLLKQLTKMTIIESLSYRNNVSAKKLCPDFSVYQISSCGTSPLYLIHSGNVLKYKT